MKTSNKKTTYYMSYIALSEAEDCCFYMRTYAEYIEIIGNKLTKDVIQECVKSIMQREKCKNLVLLSAIKLD